MLSVDPYLDALKQMETQFEFLRYAFEKLSRNKAEEFFSSKRQSELSHFSSKLEMATAQGLLDQDISQDLASRKAKILSKKLNKENQALYRTQFVPDDLNKSELLLLVALFESFLKEIYESLVRAEPRRAFAKSGKEVALREIFADNVREWAKSKFFDKIVKEQVEHFDHTPFKDSKDSKKEDRTKLLAAYELKLDEKDIAVAFELIERRHKISHRWTDRNEVKHVSPKELTDAKRVFNIIPRRLISQAAEKYPQFFKR